MLRCMFRTVCGSVGERGPTCRSKVLVAFGEVGWRLYGSSAVPSKCSSSMQLERGNEASSYAGTGLLVGV